MADAAAPSKRLGDMRELAGKEVTQLALLASALGFSKEAKRACRVRQKRLERMVIGMGRQKTSTFVNMIRRLVMGLKSLILKEKTTKGIDAKEDPAQGRLPAIITYLRHNSERSDIAKNQITSTFVNFTWPHGPCASHWRGRREPRWFNLAFSSPGRSADRPGGITSEARLRGEAPSGFAGGGGAEPQQ